MRKVIDVSIALPGELDESDMPTGSGPYSGSGGALKRRQIGTRRRFSPYRRPGPPTLSSVLGSMAVDSSQPARARANRKSPRTSFAVHTNETCELESLKQMLSGGPPTSRRRALIDSRDITAEHQNANADDATDGTDESSTPRITSSSRPHVPHGKSNRPKCGGDRSSTLPHLAAPLEDVAYEYTLQADGSMAMEIIRPCVTDSVCNMPRLRPRMQHMRQTGVGERTLRTTSTSSRAARPPMEWLVGPGGARTPAPADSKSKCGHASVRRKT